MFTEKNLMFMICESPLHAGSGSELDYIDKPIQRERHTGFPKIESSSLKGAIRERFLEGVLKRASPPIEAQVLFEAAFGAESKQHKAGEERQGGLAFSDARLLLFPVKSMKGVFAWITCPFVLKRFEEDMRRIGKDFKIEGLPEVAKDQAVVFPDKQIFIESNGKEHVILEEYPFDANEYDSLIVKEKNTSTDFTQWLASKLFASLDWWKNHLQKNMVIISDEDFADFTEMSTEIITRNRIDSATGTVIGGGLFTEEYLPTDSILYSLVMAHAEFAKNGGGKSDKEVMKFFTDNLEKDFAQNGLGNTFQAGGNATIGKGLLRTVVT